MWENSINTFIDEGMKERGSARAVKRAFLDSPT